MGPPVTEDGASMYHTAPVMRSQPMQLPKIGPKTLSARQMAQLSARLAVPRALVTDLSFGEEIVHETLNRHRKKVLDQDRLDLLAAPRRRGASCMAWGAEKPDPLLTTGMSGVDGDSESFGMKFSSRRNMQETGSSFRSNRSNRSKEGSSGEERQVRLQDIVDRLATPKGPRTEPKTTGDKILAQAKEANSQKKIDVHMLSARLSSPKASHPGPIPLGDKLILEAMQKSKNKKVDRNRILFLAVPTKPGASSHSCRRPVQSSQDGKKSEGYAAAAAPAAAAAALED